MTGSTRDSEFARAFARSVSRACGYIDAAIYELELMAGDDVRSIRSASTPSCGPNVDGLIEAEDWTRWPPTSRFSLKTRCAGQDADSYGEGLYARALGDAGGLRPFLFLSVTPIIDGRDRSARHGGGTHVTPARDFAPVAVSPGCEGYESLLVLVSGEGCGSRVWVAPGGTRVEAIGPVAGGARGFGHLGPHAGGAGYYRSRAGGG